jgi:hypothetical protein
MAGALALYYRSLGTALTLLLMGNIDVVIFKAKIINNKIPLAIERIL